MLTVKKAKDQNLFRFFLEAFPLAFYDGAAGEPSQVQPNSGPKIEKGFKVKSIAVIFIITWYNYLLY